MIDLIVLFLLLIVAVVYSFLLQGHFIGSALISGAVFFIVPSLYLGARRKKNWRKIAASVITFGGIAGLGFEFLAEYNGAYNVISSVFPFKLFGVVPPDNVIGHMMMTLYTIVFYQHFISKKESNHISKNVKHAIVIFSGSLLTILLIYKLNPLLITFPYPYLYIGTIAILAPIFLGILRPKFISNMIKIIPFFFLLYLVCEITAVKLDWWIYRGNSIAKVSFFNTTFPFEEFFFWIIFYAPTLVSWYEMFINDNTDK